MQVSQPWVQKRHIAYAKHKHVISGILQHLKMRALGWLLDDDGEPNKEVIDKLVFRAVFCLDIVGLLPLFFCY